MEVVWLLLCILFFPSSPLERASAAKRSEAAAWSRPRHRRGPKTTSIAISVGYLCFFFEREAAPVPFFVSSSSVAGNHLGLCRNVRIIVLSVFWLLRFLQILGGFRVPILRAFRVPWTKNFVFFSFLFPGHFSYDIWV